MNQHNSAAPVTPEKMITSPPATRSITFNTGSPARLHSKGVKLKAEAVPNTSMTTVTSVTATELCNRNSSATAAITTLRPASEELKAAIKNKPKNNIASQ